MPIADVIARLQVEGEERFGSTMQGASRSTEQAGEGAEKASKGFGGMTKNLAVAAGGAVAIKKGFDFLKGATGNAQALAKQTAAMTRQTGMDTKAASGWVSMAKSRGIESAGLTRSFTALSRQLSSAEQGSKTAIGSFERLGVSMDDIRGKPFEQQLGAVADQFEKLPAGADKAALATKFFGRQGLELLPILNSGSAGIAEQMKELERAGLTMDESGVKKALELGKAQRQMKASMDGVKTSIGNALIPVLVIFAQRVTPIVQSVGALLAKAPALTFAVIALAGAFAAILVVAKINAVLTQFGQGLGMLQQQTFLQAAASKVAAAAQWLWNVAMSANPIMLVVLAVAALVAGVVIAYMKIGAFRDLVQAAFAAIKNAAAAAFRWIKSNWPLLLAVLAGPFGLAVGLVIKNFGKIRSAASSAKDFVVKAFQAIVSHIRGLPGEIAGVASHLFESIVNAAKALPGQVLGAIGDLGNRIKDKIMGPLSGVGSAIASLNPFGTGGLIAAQTGANLTGRRPVLVGERGPEIATMPSGTRITPLPPPMLAASQLGGGGGRPMIAQVFLDRRMIAEAMASEAADRQAAR